MCPSWKGSMELDLPQNTFARHEYIKGAVILRLKKPIEARELFVRLTGTETVVNENGFNGEQQRDWITICDKKITLGGQGMYSSGVYDFQMEVPDVAIQKLPESSGLAVDILTKIAEAAQTHGVIEWHLTARLDIPKGLDITEKKRIYFRRTGDETGDYVGPGFKDHHQRRTAISQRRSRIAKGMKDTPGDEVYSEAVGLCPQCESPYLLKKKPKQCDTCGEFLPED